MRRWTWPLAAMLLVGHAVAQEPRYVDPDPAASYLGYPPGGRVRFRSMIQAALQKNPRNVSALVQRAHLYGEMGDRERELRDYDAALGASEPASPQRRHVHWSRGWSRYDQGDIEGALSDWAEAERLHGGRPAWVTYTRALAYWTVGDHATALHWYALAASGYPEWGTDEGMEQRIRYWSKPQQARMRALYAHWKAG